MQKTGRKRGDCDHGKHGKIVGGLGLGALFWGISLGQQRGAADEHKVPPEPERDQTGGKVREFRARQADDNGQRLQRSTDGDDIDDAKPLDQVAGEKAR